MPCSAPTQCICKRAVQNVSCGGISIVLNKPYKTNILLLCIRERRIINLSKNLMDKV